MEHSGGPAGARTLGRDSGGRTRRTDRSRDTTSTILARSMTLQPHRPYLPHTGGRSVTIFCPWRLGSVFRLWSIETTSSKKGTVERESARSTQPPTRHRPEQTWRLAAVSSFPRSSVGMPSSTLRVVRADPRGPHSGQHGIPTQSALHYPHVSRAGVIRNSRALSVLDAPEAEDEDLTSRQTLSPFGHATIVAWAARWASPDGHHGPGVTTVQKRTRCRTIRPDPAAIGNGARVKAVSRTDACKAVPCRTYPARFRIGYGLDASTVSASRRNRWNIQASRSVALFASQT